MNYEETCVECGGKIIYTSSGGTCTLCGQPDTIHSAQTDPNAAYNVKVRQIAEMIAKDILQDQWERMSAESNEYRIERKMPIARVMVAQMAKRYREGYEQAARDYGYAIAHSDPDINNYLIECGLIPAIPDTKIDDNAR